MLAYIYRAFDWNWKAAQTELQRALAIEPTNSGALQTAGMLSYTLGRWDDAERQFRAALERDPLNPYYIWTVGLNYYLAGRYEESEDAYRQLLEVEPDFLWTRSYLSKTLVALGKSQVALAILQQEADEGSRLLYLPIVLQAAGRHADADEALEAQIAYWADTGAFYVAQTYAYRGERDLALEWLERAYKQKDVALVEITGEPLFSSLADDPRFIAFLRKMKLPEWPRV
jgi:tetratricopeptide (TPR) repeat protein